MFLKYHPGLNFINVLRTAYKRSDPESVTIQSNPQYLLCFWDLRAQKLYVKTLMKLTPSWQNMHGGLQTGLPNTKFMEQ